MEKQRQRARKARENSGVSWEEGNNQLEDFKSTKFVGYEVLSTSSKVLEIIKNEDEKVSILLEKTPFYAESGGQISDQGKIFNDNFLFEVQNVIKDNNNHFIHTGVIKQGDIENGEVVKLAINKSKRNLIKRNHTATHLLHKALKEVLGDHVNQAGSLVTNEKLRFDFTHFSSLTENELELIESKVNKIINSSLEVKTTIMDIDTAINEGAVALFDEKYDQKVRVVSAGDYTRELCGGTHVNNTSEIGQFVILSEGSIGSGIRRIEAIVGYPAYNYMKDKYKKLKEVKEILKAGQIDIVKKTNEIIEKLSQLEKENKSLEMKLFNYSAQGIIDEGKTIEDIFVISSIVNVNDMESLRKYADVIKSKKPESVIVLGCEDGEKVYLLASVSDTIVKEKSLNAGKIIKDIAKMCDGGGGGRPQMAQAGGKSPEKLPNAIKEVPNLVLKFLDK